MYDRFKKLIRKASNQSAMAMKHPDEKNIHDLRVSIKRLKAFYRLLLSVDSDFPYRLYMAPWKASYEQFGHIRNQQVVLKLSKSCAKGLNIPYKSELPPGNQANKIEFHKIKKSLITESQSAVKDSLRKLSWSRAEKYLRCQFHKIDKMLHHENIEKKERIHDLRKALKDFNYNLRFLSEINTDNYDKKSLAWMKNIMEVIGKWLDLNMALKALKYNHIKHDIGESEKYLKLIRNEFKTERENLAILIMQMWETGKILLVKEEPMKGIKIPLPKTVRQLAVDFQ